MGYDPEIIEKVRQLNVIDDVMFQKMAEDKNFCSELISTILQNHVEVVETTPQNSIKNLQGRSVVLDALCLMENDKLVNVEVQKANDDNHLKRVRYNSACITANITEPGEKFENVPDIYSIFITKFDMFKGNRTVYHVKHMICETGEKVENGQNEIYINTKINDGSDIAELMRIFTEKDTYNFSKFPKCSKRKEQFKMTEEGEASMCEIVEEYANKKVEETKRVSIKKMLERGDSMEEILEIFSELSETDIRKIKSEM